MEAIVFLIPETVIETRPLVSGVFESWNHSEHYTFGCTGFVSLLG